MNEFLLGKLKAKGWVAADADPKTDADAVAKAKVAAGELDLKDYVAWCNEFTAESAKKSSEAELKLKGLVSEPLAQLSAKLDKLVDVFVASKSAPQTDDKSAERLAAEAEAAAKRFDAAGAGVQTKTVETEVGKQFAGTAGQTTEPRVKKASESYSSTKTTLTYKESRDWKGQRAGDAVKMFTDEKGTYTTLDELSRLENAKAAVWFKFKTRGLYKGHMPQLNDHEMQLLLEILHEDRFVGIPIKGSDATESRKLHDFEIKAILDDGTSGGQEAVPEFFDTGIITPPLLNGELLPFVNIIPMARGSSVDGFSHGTPTFLSTASGQAVNEFNTAGFIAAFDTPVFPATCAISWGLDFESDTLPTFGASVLNQIGQEALRWADEQIAVGDGTSEPQGIFTATGVNVPSVGGTGALMKYTDALNLVFGIGKAARNALGGNRCRYVMKDSQYKRMMQIVTGVTGDERPIFGMNTQEYRLGEYGVSVQDNITAGEIAFCNLAAYRMYRRQSLQFTTTTEGDTLLRSNRRLVVARMRWGGKLTLPTTYCAQMSDAYIY